jgi:hypothetical protein
MSARAAFGPTTATSSVFTLSGNNSRANSINPGSAANGDGGRNIVTMFMMHRSGL